MSLVEDLISAYQEAERVAPRLTRVAVRERALTKTRRLLDEISHREASEQHGSRTLSEVDQLRLYKYKDRLISQKQRLPRPESLALKTPHVLTLGVGVIAPSALFKLKLPAAGAVALFAFVLLSGLRGVLESRARRLMGVPGALHRRARQSTDAYTIELHVLHTLGMRPTREPPREAIFYGFMLLSLGLVGLVSIAFATAHILGAPTDHGALDFGIGLCGTAVLGTSWLVWVTLYRAHLRRRLWHTIASGAEVPARSSRADVRAGAV
jgi:hypothetical protein